MAHLRLSGAVFIAIAISGAGVFVAATAAGSREPLWASAHCTVRASIRDSGEPGTGPHTKPP
jgi:hypothetical protein